jgi:hypothetical protein
LLDEAAHLNAAAHSTSSRSRSRSRSEMI